MTLINQKDLSKMKNRCIRITVNIKALRVNKPSKQISKSNNHKTNITYQMIQNIRNTTQSKRIIYS